MEGTRLADIYREKRYTPPTLDEYTELCAECVARLNPEIVIHRLTGDCPKDMLIAPNWNKDKNEIIKRINDYLACHGYKQGSLYKAALN